MFPRRPDYLLKVRGMSMRDAGILDGDLLAVQKSKEAKNGQIVVARLGDEVTVKRFRRTKQHVELLPENPDESAARLRHSLAVRFGREIAVVINDSFGRPWRLGTTGTALGVAGLPALVDLRGQPDLFGRPLRQL